MDAATKPLLIPSRTHYLEAQADSEAVQSETQGKRSGMWLVSVLVPLLKLYFCGIRVLIYQMFNKSFVLPGLVNLHFIDKITVKLCKHVMFFFLRAASMLNENASLKRRYSF